MHMEKINQRTGGSCWGVLQAKQLNRAVRPLLRKMKQQRRDCIEGGRRIFNKLQEVDVSIEIIAREMARQSKKKDKRE